MSPDIADVAKTSTPATALASPSSTIEKSNQVGIEITSSQTQEGALWNEAGLDTASPSLPIDESDMAPSQTSPAESTEHLASVEKTSDMASPFSTIGRLNTSSDETISSDTQEITHSTEALRYITPSYFELDKSDTAASKMASSQTLTVELVNSTEAVTDMDSKNSDADAPITGSDLIIITKDPKIQEQSISAESPPGNDCSRVVTDRQNMTSELAEATSVEILELPFGPFPVGDTQETAPPSPVAETSRTSSISQPMELNSPERNDRGTSEEDASSTTSHFSNICDAYNKSEMTDKSPTESPKLTFSTDQELRQGPPNISLSPYSLSTTDRGGDVVESCLTELIDPNPSSQVTPEIDSPYLGVCKINAISEGVQASLIETTESASTAADTSDKASQSLTPDDSSVVPDPFETISAEGQEHIMLAEVSQEVDLHLPSADGLRRETEFAETSSTELSELCHSPKDTQDESSSASSPIASAMGSSSYERNATDIHEESISEDALDEQTHPFSIGGVHRESGFVESSSVEMADFDFSAASISDTAFPSTVAALPPVILEGLEGFEFSQPEVEDQTVSERTSGMNSPTYSVDGRDVAFRFDEEHTTNMIDFNLPAGATLEMGHSIADETSIPEGFDLSSIATQDHPDPEGALNDPSFSIGVLNEDFDNDDTTMTEMYDLFSSADTGVEMPGSLTCEMPTIMASESLEMSSPEIKLEPISMDGISHMDSLPSATLNQDIVSQLIGECAPETREVTLLSEATPDTAPTLEADASTVIDGDIEMSSFDMQLVPVSASEDTVSPCMIPANTSKSSRKRVHFDVDDHGDDQYPPAKKMQREFIAVWDVPRMKTIDLLSGDIETGLLNVQQLPSPIDSLPDMTSPLASPINANMTFDTTETSHCNTRGVSLSADLPLKLSIDVKHADPEITPTTTSTFIESPLTKIKKNLANETIELRVGPKNKCVLAHKHILAKSSFFKSLFHERPIYQEPSQVYHLPEFDTYALATIIHWLYYGNIQSIAQDYKADEIFNTAHMIKVYCLCSRLELRSLMKLAIELLGYGYFKNKSAPTIEEIDSAYSETDQLSGLRIYMAAWARCREHAPLQKFMMAGPWDTSQFETLRIKHLDLSKDMEGLDESSGPESPISLNPRFHQICWYHDHPQGEQCGVSGETFENACNAVDSRLHEPI